MRPSAPSFLSLEWMEEPSSGTPLGRKGQLSRTTKASPASGLGGRVSGPLASRRPSGLGEAKAACPPGCPPSPETLWQRRSQSARAPVPVGHPGRHAQHLRGPHRVLLYLCPRRGGLTFSPRCRDQPPTGRPVPRRKGAGRGGASSPSWPANGGADHAPESPWSRPVRGGGTESRRSRTGAGRGLVGAWLTSAGWPGVRC